MTTNKDETRLLPCPFCGGEAYYNFTDAGNDRKFYRVHCKECDARIGHPYVGKDAARDAWNTRAKPQRQTMERIVTIMKDLIQRPRQAKHQARVYATEAEWEQLQKLGIGPERDRIMAAINKRSKAEGKEK